jgi:hypothetical protein
MDYCTLFPEGWWATCCQAHDLAYSLQIGKEAADQALMLCVAGSGHGPVLGAASVVLGGAMWLGVRLFGRKYYKAAGKGKV